jgi:predicted dehydrogenase
MIGSGAIAQTVHLPAYEKLQAEGKAKIVAVCDANEATAKAAQEKFDVPHLFTDYSQMLAMDEVDAVDVCTPNFLHKQPVLDAFAAGKHVICEKPIALNGKEGAEMVDAGRKAGKKFMVALNMRFGGAPQAIKRFIDDGKLGEVYYARAQALRRRGVPSWGVFTQKDKQGGGPLIDIGVHILDMTLWLMGHPKPISATGQTYQKFGRKPGVFNPWGAWDPNKFTVEDFAAGFVRFENGATLTLESSFIANGDDVYQTTLYGTEGGVVLDLNATQNTKFFREESGSLTDSSFVSLPSINSYEIELRGFVQAILDDVEVPIPGEQGLMVTHILDALYTSSETGQVVTL